MKNYEKILYAIGFERKHLPYYCTIPNDIPNKHKKWLKLLGSMVTEYENEHFILRHFHKNDWFNFKYKDDKLKFHAINESIVKFDDFISAFQFHNSDYEEKQFEMQKENNNLTSKFEIYKLYSYSLDRQSNRDVTKHFINLLLPVFWECNYKGTSKNIIGLPHDKIDNLKEIETLIIEDLIKYGFDMKKYKLKLFQNEDARMIDNVKPAFVSIELLK